MRFLIAVVSRAVCFGRFDGWPVPGWRWLGRAGGLVAATVILVLPAGAARAALYSGDANFGGSPGSLPNGQAPDPIFTVVLVQNLPNPSEVGQPVTFNVVISWPPSYGSAITPTGTLTFRYGNVFFPGPLIATVPVTGTRTFFTTSTLAEGLQSILIEYSGDANFEGSSDTPLQVVNPPTCHDIDDAFNRGFNTGFHPGFNAGFNPGYRAGFNRGYHVGFGRSADVPLAGAQAALPPACNPHFDRGFNTGFRPGFDSGFNRGFQVGFNPGFTAGFRARHRR